MVCQPLDPADGLVLRAVAGVSDGLSCPSEFTIIKNAIDYGSTLYLLAA